MPEPLISHAFQFFTNVNIFILRDFLLCYPLIMSKFVLKEIKNSDLVKELENIGFDKCYREKGQEKYKYKNLKIFNLTIPQANILKQIALTVGADCAVHREVITGKVETSDVILGGSYSELRKIAEKLKFQPFSLKKLSEEIIKQLEKTTSKTKLVGILNVTNNSFSDGGKYLDIDSAKIHFNQLIQNGADIIDIGAESTKLNAEAIPAEIQLKRILPLLDKNYTISIDTRSSIVAEECLKNGAKIINDVSGLKYDPKMAEVIAKYDATVVIQHSINRQNQGSNVEPYQNVIDEVYLDLYKQTEYAKSEGIKNIIIDVGIGFDKTLEDNFRLFNRINEFKSLGYPIMLGISRKSLLQLNNHTNEEKDIFTLALNTIAIEHNIDYIRVHNVKLHHQLIDIYKKEII